MLQVEPPPRNAPPVVDAPPKQKPADDATTKLERAWRCKRCDHAITSDESRVEVDGRHVHMRLNPAAFAFIFGCFKDAPGCVVVGEPTADATWFSGHRWQYAMCGGCGAHLGWAFSGASSFFGLVLERLVEPSP